MKESYLILWERSNFSSLKKLSAAGAGLGIASVLHISRSNKKVHFRPYNWDLQVTGAGHQAHVQRSRIFCTFILSPDWPAWLPSKASNGSRSTSSPWRFGGWKRSTIAQMFVQSLPHLLQFAVSSSSLFPSLGAQYRQGRRGQWTFSFRHTRNGKNWP